MVTTRNVSASLAIVAAVAIGAAACGSFEDPAIVIDLRALAMTAEPPEQLVDIDPRNPDPASVKLGPVKVCGLVADPADARGLGWRMRACPVGGDLRCEDEDPRIVFGAGVIDDPETADTPQVMCAEIPGGDELVALVTHVVLNDSLSGFGGVEIMTELRVAPPGAGEDVAIYAAKRIRFGARLPAGRTPNQNPRVERFDARINEGETFALPLGRCRDQAAPVTLAPGEELYLEPVEPAGVREDYVVPTFDGGARMFTENLRYQWLSSAGDWRRGGTGGERDPFGNSPPLDTTWRTPPREDLDGPRDVSLWINQRDERDGNAWYESCVRVVP